MAYRQTDKTRAHKAAQRENIITAALDVISRQGIDGMTTKAVAQRADVAPGLLFTYFADMSDLAAHIEAAVISRDVEAMTRAARDVRGTSRAQHALSAGISALFDRLAGNGYSRAMAQRPGYRFGIVRQLTPLIHEANPDLSTVEARLAAQASLGVICGLASSDGPAGKRASLAVLFVLRGIGLKERGVEKASAL